MRIRRLNPDDEEAYRSIFDRTTREDRYFRFFVALDHLDPADVRRAVEDRADSIGYLAMENGRSLGVAHGELLEDGSAELTVLVAKDARRRGVATALIRVTIAHLHELGVQRIVAYSLRENYTFSEFGRSIGLKVERAERLEILWTLAPERSSIEAA